MSIMEHNGAAIVAMKGKNCVVIAADRRFGVGAQTVAMDFQKIFQMGPTLFAGFAGLATDVQTVNDYCIARMPYLSRAVVIYIPEDVCGEGYIVCVFVVLCRAERLKFRVNLYELRENRHIKPKTLMNVVSNLLYERRFGPYFIDPIIAGVDPKTGEPFVASCDLIGCYTTPEDFVVAGTCTEQLYGMCESLWEPNMDAEALFEATSQALLNAVDRDAVSGWGAIVHIIEKDKVTTRTLKARMD